MYTPSQANIAKFTQHVLNAPIPSTYKPVVSNTNSNYDMMNGLMDRLQAKMNPQIQQANSNASMIHNYLAGQTQYPTYSHANVGAGSIATGPVQVKGTMPQAPAPSSMGMDYSNYAQYLPHLQDIANQVMQQRMPKVQDSVDLSPYTAFAQNAHNRSIGGANV